MKKTNKALIFDIQSFSIQDGPGIRITVFLKGCPLCCSWCHNPEGISFEQQQWVREQKTGKHIASKILPVDKNMTTEEVMEKINKEVLFFDESGGGVTVSGGEPLSHEEFTFELLKKCQEQYIHTCIDTSGYARWETFEKLLPVTDLFLYDLKIADPKEHHKHTGKDNTEILKNLYKLNKTGKEIVVRIPLVENITDTQKNIEGLIKIIHKLEKPAPIELLPFHNIAKKKYKSLNKECMFDNTNNYPVEKAHEIQEVFLKHFEIVSVRE